MFDMCTTGDAAYIDMVFKFLPHTHTHTRFNMGTSIFFTAAMIRAFRSARSCGNGGNEYPVLSVGGSFLRTLPRNAWCTVTADLLVWYSYTQNDFSPRVAIFSLHTLTSPSGRNVNYNEKQHMEWNPTDVTILFVDCWISTCFGPTGPSSGEFVQLFTQPLVQYLCRSVRVLSYRAREQSGTNTEPMVVWTAVRTLLKMGMWARNM